MADIAAEDIFQMHPQIRWAALASDNGELIFSAMRPGTEAYSPERDDQFLLLGGLIMDGVAQRQSQWLGKFEFVFVAYENATQIVAHVQGGYVVLTVEPSVSTEEVMSIAKRLPELCSSHMTEIMRDG
jgi:hypothetical protein